MGSVTDNGVVGLNLFQKYASPDRLIEALELSEPLNEILRKFFKTDPKKRPRSFELSASEFLATDAPIMLEGLSFHQTLNIGTRSILITNALR